VAVSKTREEIVNSPNELSFLDQAPEMQCAIVAAADENNDWHSPVATDVMRRLSKTGTTLHGFFRPELDQRDAKQLLIYVLQSNEARAAEVLKIAKANPRLFFIKATAQDYAMDLEGNQRTIKDWSPYQALFGTGDKDMLAAVKPDLDAYLDTLQDGRKMAAEQEREKFPKDIAYPSSTKEFNRLVNELAAAITNDPQLRTNWKHPNPATFALLVQLRQCLKPGIVETGHHFNLNDFFITHCIAPQYWEQWNGHQFRFFAVNVIGFQERLMTAPQLQAVCMGINNYLNMNQPLKHSTEVINFETKERNKMTIAPLSAEDPTCRLGEGFMIETFSGGAGVPRRRTPVGLDTTHPTFLENYIKQTQRSFQDLRACSQDARLLYA
jgi:hypothetical protein